MSSCNISDSEWEVMNLLWDQAPQTSTELIKQLEETHKWKPTTVKTLLARLVEKEAVHYTVQGKSYYYEPAVSKETCLKNKSDLFLKKFHGGHLKSLIASFVDCEPVDSETLEALKKLLASQKEDS